MSIKKQRLIGESGYTPTHYALPNQANTGGGGAGSPVTASFANYFVDPFNNPQLPDPPNYSVAVTPSQACLASVVGKTSTGFSVVLTPTPSSSTLAAGSFDVIVSS
jgi:hypothetical protein